MQTIRTSEISTYQDFKDLIAQDKEHKIENYYNYIIKFASDILLDLNVHSRKEVASSLGMSYMKLTHMIPLLTALALAKLGGSDD